MDCEQNYLPGAGMGKRRTGIERRSRKRQPVKNSALAVNADMAGRILFGQIVDLSLDGLCFNYIENVPCRGLPQTDGLSWGNETLDIVCSSCDFILTDLPVRPVCDRETAPPGSHWPASRWRCKCFEFGELTTDQHLNLKEFIQINRKQGGKLTSLINEMG